MARYVTRRSFMKKSAAAGAATVVGGSVLGNMISCGTAPPPDISVAQGTDYFENTIHAVGQLGGMGKFVKPGAKVAVLANPQRNNPGAFTSPQVLKAALKMAREAGAAEVACPTLLPEQNWESTGMAQVVQEEGAKMVFVDRRDDANFTACAIPEGIALKEAKIMTEFFNYDTFIDIPICKDHAGNKFTGTMKNLMGLNSAANNWSFHKPNWQTDPDDIAFLDQCIADLNSITRITPDLCIVDATEFIITNGPMGPGEIIKPQKVVAGTDRVALDSYCCTLWGLNAGDIIMINKAFEHKLGERDISKLTVKVTEV